ncbi:hypothetical protein GLOIN_2v1785920 [Rhizophagus clarus]|uniref:Uncharacterized protein n=1 Tax=Rhizophagus clarus TaxID=94130 RepID=A0A8H3QMS5_9GLOM|nr:hypothetical protein GLOIN_2v1785920 [Rhizophagus clarus]
MKKKCLLRKKIHETYLTESTKKSTFYDNYEPSRKWTKTVKDDEWNFKEVEVKIKNLKEELKRDQHRISVIKYNKKRAIFEMLKQVKENKKGLIKASVKVVELIFIDSKHQKIIQLVDDKDIAVICQVWIPRWWLNVLGFFYQQQKQGVNFDKHERDNVVKYRKMFLNEMAKYEPYMSSYERETMDQVLLNLQSSKKEHILIIYDECIFYSNDNKCEKNQEGYWTMNYLLEQVKLKAIPIFEALFPTYIAVFAFNNNSNHAAFLPDTLVASKMKFFSGEK